MSQIDIPAADAETIWARPADLTEIPWPDLDTADERQHRAQYTRRERRSGYATCYRCDENASMFIRLRISSLTAVCRTHSEAITFTRDQYGTLYEAGPYQPHE